MIDKYNFKSCTAGLLRSGVLVSGDVTPCVTIRDVALGNLYQDSWKEIWNRARERFLGLKETAGGQCTINLLLRHEASAQTGTKLKMLNC